MKKCRVLVTGASGFIGKYFLEYLSGKGHEIYCTKRQREIDTYNDVKWVQCDILSASDTKYLLKELKPDYLVHCAWYVNHGDCWNSSENLDFIFATVELWRYFVENGGRRAVFLGSCAEQIENFISSINQNIYGKSKHLTSQLISLTQEANHNDSSFIWGRAFNVYGPGEPREKLLSYLITSFLNNQSPEIKTPLTTLDFVYVKNLAHIIYNSLFSSEYGVKDFAQGLRFNIGDLATYIHKNYFPDKKPPLLYQNDEKPKLILAELSWMKNLDIERNFISLDKSIHECIDHIKTKS